MLKLVDVKVFTISGDRAADFALNMVRDLEEHHTKVVLSEFYPITTPVGLCYTFSIKVYDNA
jgi:hypothetical protein